ncbi:MAG: protein kinase, partial [Deltaproteobacteria bacterium]|nr:protein kinase [Nannocystaceae bacterium]
MAGPRSDDGELITRPDRAKAGELPRSDQDTLPTPPAGWSLRLGAPPNDSGEDAGGDGLESAVLLARARRKLLGWAEVPVVVGRYKVLERIGQGGMGVVYAAHDDELDRDVAIKILRSELAPGTAGRQRLVREAQATAKLSHPNVVHVYEVGQQGEQVFMAMELVRGRTLRAWCEASSRPWRELVAMFVQAGEGLVAAHAHGIIHRDFKPDNVLIGEGPSGARPQIVDFGLARASSELGATGEHPVLRDLDITRTGTVVGTPAYMAPEQLARGEPDARSDQFSFCVALHEALYRRRPFAGSTYTELADSLTAGIPIVIDDKRDVPAMLHAVVMKGLRRDPAERHASMRALLDALTALLQPVPRTRAGLVAVLAAIATAAAVVAVAWVLRAPQQRVPSEPEPEPEIDPWAAIVAASDLPPVVDTPLPDDPIQMSVQRLRNGLTVYVAHRPLEPMVTVGVAVRAGPTEAGTRAVGMAGLVESALMYGTERVGIRDAAIERPQLIFQHRLLERLPEVREPAARELVLQAVAASERASAAQVVRGELFTSNDAIGGGGALILERHGTLFAVKQPAHRIGTWLEVVGEMLQRPVFRQFLAVTAERMPFVGGFGADTPADAARYRELAPATGIRRDRELAVAQLLEVPLADARAFHDAYYRPNNTALIFVGDITVAQAVAVAEQHLGSWAPQPIPSAPVVDIPLAQPRTLIETTVSGPPVVRLSWPMPPLGTPAHAQLETLVTVLRGRMGLLGASLQGELQGWGAYVGDARDLHLLALPRAGQRFETVERAAASALAAIADDELDDAAWTAALAEAELERLAWARSPGQLMIMTSESFFGRQSWATTARSIASAAPERTEIVAAARLLRDRPHVVSYEHTGKV